ncbi:MAG: hypothetical protein HKP32_06475 [Woeseia sp.]|nr:hypothetical protein [Woeseia sp.]
MSPPEINNFILNGFDRCGSSAISRTIATHPDIEIIMQPFNSGSIRSKLYQVINDGNATEQDFAFFRQLEQGVLDRTYIKSTWFEKYSSTLTFLEGKLHLIKTTQNHFTIAWIKQNFPLIENWGIWRHPYDTLASLVRNDFHTRWYAGAAAELAKTVLEEELLRSRYAKFLNCLESSVQEMAYILSVRTWFYFHHVDPEKVISYDAFVIDANQALQPLLGYFQLKPFRFVDSADSDLNIVGKQYVRESSHVECIPESDRETCEQLFVPLYELAETRGFS